MLIVHKHQLQKIIASIVHFWPEFMDKANFLDKIAEISVNSEDTNKDGYIKLIEQLELARFV